MAEQMQNIKMVLEAILNGVKQILLLDSALQNVRIGVIFACLCLFVGLLRKK